MMKIITRYSTIEIFQTKNLFARKLTLDDFDFILALYQNKLVMQQMGDIPSQSDIYKKFLWNLEKWERDHFGQWLWFDKISHTLVGRGGLRRINLNDTVVVELGYALMPNFWNKGRATEIASASVEIAFEILKLQSLVAFTPTTNIASQHVIEKAGFKIFKNFVLHKQSYVLYQLNLKN